MRLNKNIKIFLNYFLGPLLFVWLSFSIYEQIRVQPGLEESWQHIKQSLQSSTIFNLIVVIMLMFVNWGIEAWKWKISVAHVQQVSFLKAYKAILSGVSFAVNTPNRMGEYAGRVLYMNDGNRLRTVSLTILGSMSQLIVTLFAGLFGFLFLEKDFASSSFLKGVDSTLWLSVIRYGTILGFIFLTVIYFRLGLLPKLFERLPKLQRYNYLVAGLHDANATLLWRLLSMSAVRYLVFVIQYFLLFRLFDVQLNVWSCFCTVSVVFLVLAIIPTFAIAELGIRGEVSLKIIGLFSANTLGILWTTATIWMINLVIPAVAGSLLILGLKIFKNRNEESD